MDEPTRPTDEDRTEQEPELLPPREAMSILNPLPPVGAAGDEDLLMPVDPKPGHPIGP